MVYVVWFLFLVFAGIYHDCNHITVLKILLKTFDAENGVALQLQDERDQDYSLEHCNVSTKEYYN